MNKKVISFDQDKPTLYIVSTPIGNLEDITFRAVSTLKAVDVIFAEDTRVTSKLLNHFGISTKLLSYQGYDEKTKSDQVLSYLHEGKSVALVSDAGTPLLSDPGSMAVAKAIDADFPVVPIPGASALLSGLVASGLKFNRFSFLGFLPRKQNEIEKLMVQFKDREEAIIIYESPLRIKKTLSLIHQILGDRPISIARELTKKFETFIYTTLEQIDQITFDQRGEYVVIIEGIRVEKTIIEKPKTLVKKYILLGYDEKDAIKMAAKDLKVHKSVVYKEYKID